MNNSTPSHPIDVFLSEAERRLRRHVPASHLQTILREARGHLEQRAADLMAEGMSGFDSAYASVAAFGEPRAWAREIIDAQYADAGTGLASRIALTGALAATIAYLLLNCGDLVPAWGGASIADYPGASVCVLAVLIVGLGTLGLASFRARQPRVFLLILLGLVTAASLFGAYGLTSVTVEDFDAPYRRQEIPGIVKAYAQSVVEPSQDYPLLHLGHLIFRGARTHPSMAIPAKLRSNGGYIVPLPLAEQLTGPLLWQSAFKKPIVVDPSNRAYSLWLARHRTQLEEATPYRTVATIPEATIAWEWDSRQYLIEDAVMLQSTQREIKNFRTALARSPRFDQDAGWYGAQIAWNGCLVLIGLHILAALLGRWVFRMRIRKTVSAT